MGTWMGWSLRVDLYEKSTNKLKFSEKEHLLFGHVYKNRKKKKLYLIALWENNVNLSFPIFCGSPV